MIIPIKPPRDRIPGPMPANRICPGCGAKLSRYNPSDRCAPCGGWPKKRIVHTLDDLHELMEAA